MITLQRDGLTIQVALDIQAAAFEKHGYLRVEEKPEQKEVPPVDTKQVGVNKQPEPVDRKKPVGRKKKTPEA